VSNLNPVEAESVTAFISYSHDSLEHMNRVGELCDRLRAEGVDCHIDQYEPSPPEGWSLWTLNQMEEADFILVVCTETYYRRVRGREEPRKGLGVKWEGMLITQSIYESVANKKFIPVVFSAQDAEHVPVFLRAYTYYNLETDEGYEALYRRLTNQPYFQKPQIGRLRLLGLLNRADVTPAVAKGEVGKMAEEDHESIQAAGYPENTFQDRESATTQTGAPTTGRATGGDGEAHTAQIWIICAVLFVSVVAVFILAPDKLPEYKQRVLAIVCAVLSGALSFLLSGRIAVKYKAIKSQLGEITVQSTGGVAVFALVLWWWLSPLSPVVAVPPSATPNPEIKPETKLALTPLINKTMGSMVYDVALSRGGELLASSEDDGSVRLWQTAQENGPRLLEKEGDVKRARCVALSPDGGMVASGSDDGKIRLWRTDTGRLHNIWRAHTAYVFDIYFDDKRVISAGEDSDGVRAVKVWRSDGKILKNWSNPELKDRIIAVNPGTQAVAILSALGGNIHLWSYGDNRQLKVLSASGVKVRGGSFSLDGGLFVAGSEDGLVRLWRVSDGRLLDTVEDDRTEVTSIAFHPNGQLFSVGYADGSVCLWRVGEARPVEKLKGNGSGVFDIAFSFDGQVLALCGDKIIQAWLVKPRDDAK
jgi:WD40 repeat protein